MGDRHTASNIVSGMMVLLTDIMQTASFFYLIRGQIFNHWNLGSKMHRNLLASQEVLKFYGTFIVYINITLVRTEALV